MDAVDKNILYHMDYDARISLSRLAKKIKQSKQTTAYRIQRLEERQIIRGYVPIVDMHKLGLRTFRAYVRLQGDAAARERTAQLFHDSPNTLWLAALSGPWDLEVVMTAEHYLLFWRMFQDIAEQAGNITKQDISFGIVNKHFPKDYLLGTKRKDLAYPQYGYAAKQYLLDELDVRILKQLRFHARLPLTTLAATIGSSFQTVKDRLAVLEKKQIITGFRTHIDLEKIGYKHYKAAVVLRKTDDKTIASFFSFCAQYPNVQYLIHILGPWPVEIECEVKDQEELENILLALRNAFPDLVEDYVIFQVTKELKMDYLAGL